jgi:hypothetical protein
MRRIKKIYRVLNKLTNKNYIGATSKSLDQRKRDHLQKATKKIGSRFQQAIESYGAEAFVWTEIDTAQNENELAAKEKQYIIEFKAQEEGYNADRGGGFQKNIYKYDLETGVILSTFSSLSEAAQSVEVDRRTISKACLGEIKECRGYSWSYFLSDNFHPEPDQRRKKVFQFTEQGMFMRSFNSVAEASLESGVNKSSIAKCCRGIYSNAGNYLWQYQSD